MSHVVVGNSTGWLFLQPQGMVQVAAKDVRVEAPCGSMPGRLVVEVHPDTGLLEELARVLNLPITQRSVSEHDPIRARVHDLEVNFADLAKSIEQERHHQAGLVKLAIRELEKRLETFEP